MDYGIRDTKLRSIIQETNTSDDSSTPVQEQKITKSGITAAEDSIETPNVNSVFSTDPIAGQVNFGDGVQGNEPPKNESDIQATYASGLGEAGNVGLADLLEESKIRIHSYLNGQSIDDQMQEAKEKADLARQQATIGLVTGIIAGAVTISSAMSELNSFAETTRNEIIQKTGGIADVQLESRFQRLSSVLHQHANDTELQTKRLENEAANDSDFAKDSQEHTARMRDAILDFLRKLSEISPEY